MTAIIACPYRGGSEARALFELLLAYRADERVDPWPSLRELRAHWSDESAQALARTRLWRDPNHELLAFATLWDGSVLLYALRPYAPAESLLEAILAWASAAIQSGMPAASRETALYVPARDDDPTTRAMLERYGFGHEEWCTLRMARPLFVPLPEAQPAAHFAIRPLQGLAEAEAHVALQRAIFGPSAIDLAERRALMADRDYLPALDLVAVAPDGTLAAFMLGWLSREENQRCRPTFGWVDLLGTRPEYRRQGLAGALLLRGLQTMREAGIDMVRASVNSWNDNARMLLGSLGFRPRYSISWYFLETRDERAYR
jgi:mycothiol synthase